MGMFSARKRGRIFAKTDGHCGYCGIELDPFIGWHVDHMTRSRFGSGGEDNLIASCPSCNSRKQSRDVAAFRGHTRTTLINHANGIAGPYSDYLRPETAVELQKLRDRAVELLEDADIVFELQRHGIKP